METATKLRGSLDAAAARTAKLCREGKVIARFIGEELRKRGVTINRNGAATANRCAAAGRFRGTAPCAVSRRE